MLIFPGMFKRQTTGSVVCASCGYLVGVRDDDLLSLWTPQSRAVGLRPGAAQPRQRSRLRAVHDGYVHVLRADAGCDRLALGERVGMIELPVAGPARGHWSSSARAAPSRCSAARWWTPLSAGWLHGSAAAHRLQPDWIRQLAPGVAELYGAGPDGHHLHRRPALPGSCSASLAGVLSLPRCRFLARGLAHGRRVGVDLRPARRARLLRPPRRLQPGSQPRSWASDGAFMFGFLMPRHRQLRARRRVRRRLPRRDVARSVEAGAHQSHGDGAVVCLALSLLAIIVSVIAVAMRRSGRSLLQA